MLKEHLGYIADQARLDQFRAAIRQTVVPGDSVVDVGSGSGVLGLLCLQAGAAHVYAIEHGPIVEIARETFHRAGLADRVTFVRGRSQQVELPEQVDVAICDHVGYFGFDYGVIGLFQDARRRFLKTGGRIIPERIELHLAAVESEPAFALTARWQGPEVPAEYHWLRQYGDNAMHPFAFGREDLLGPPSALARIDLRGDNPAFLSSTVELSIERDGCVHGLGGWFECELAAGVLMSNSPLAEHGVDRAQVYLPIAEAVQVKADDRIKVTVMTRPDDGLTAWSMQFPRTGQHFSHSTWHGMPLAPEDFARMNPSRVPRISHEGEARAVILAYCDGLRTTREIERAVLDDHPNLFPSNAETLRFVAWVLSRDTD